MATEATRISSATAQGKNGHPLISDAKFRQLYRLAFSLQHTGQTHHQWRGCEAALAGVAAGLLAHDRVVAEYASSLDDIARARLNPRIDRGDFEQRVVAALSDAVGDRLRKAGRITAIFFDAAPDRKFLDETRALAIAAKLPVILVEHRHTKSRRPASRKNAKPAALDYPSIPVDTRDVIAMYRVAHESIARARDGSGPTHIVAVEWQPLAANQPRRSAKPATIDAVQHLEEWLRARGLPVEQWRREILAELDAAAQKAAAKTNDSVSAPQTVPVLEDKDPKARAIA